MESQTFFFLDALIQTLAVNAKLIENHIAFYVKSLFPKMLITWLQCESNAAGAVLFVLAVT